MKPSFRWSINVQAFVLGMLPATLMFMALVLFFTHSRLEEARADLVSRAQLMADQLAPALEFDLISGDRHNMRKLLDQIALSPMVQAVEVRDAFGKTLVRRESNHFQLPGSDDSLPSQLLKVKADIHQTPIDLTSGFDVFDDPLLNRAPLLLGQVEISITQDYLRASQQDIVVRSLSVAILLFLFTLLLVRLMSGHLVRPIRELSAKVRAIAQGHFQTLPVAASAHEISELSSRIDELAETLADAERRQEEQIKAIEEARHMAELASQAKSELLNLMNHELRTPVNGILGMLQLLQETPLTDEQKSLLSTALGSGESLNGLLSEIMIFSRLKESHVDLNPMPTLLREELERLEAEYRPQAERQHLDFRLRMADGLEKPWMLDPEKLRQILRSLLDNALKFTRTGGITLSAELIREIGRDPILELHVIDTGRGISPAFLDELFKPFRQEESGQNRGYGGFGLGLAIVHRLVSAQHGTIQAKSTRRAGSAFIVRLPVSAAEAAQIPAPSGPDRALCILVVEDNPVNMKITCGLLRHLGHETDQAFNGLEAIKRYQSRRYDLIIMDCQMPLMDGFTASKEIRAMESGEQRSPTPIIALTANMGADLEDKCLQAGMNQVIAKPLSKATLIRCLASLKVA